MAGHAAFPRHDGKWNVGVTPAVADQLMQIAEPKENLSDVVIRLLSKKEAA